MKNMENTSIDKNVELDITREYIDILRLGGQLSANNEENALKIKEAMDRIMNVFLSDELLLVVNNKKMSQGNKLHFAEHAMKFLSQVGSYDVEIFEIFNASRNAIIARYSFHTKTIGEIPCITIFRFKGGEISEINEVFNIDPSVTL